MRTRVPSGFLHRKAEKYSQSEAEQKAFETAWRKCEDYFGIHEFDDSVGERKICTRCRQYRSIENFYINPAYSDGHDVYCKDCRKELKITSQEKREENERHNLHRHRRR